MFNLQKEFFSIIQNYPGGDNWSVTCNRTYNFASFFRKEIFVSISLFHFSKPQEGIISVSVSERSDGKLYRLSETKTSNHKTAISFIQQSIEKFYNLELKRIEEAETA